MKVFVDSDVVISSLLSNSGAAYFLLHLNEIDPIISSYSYSELALVAKRLNIDNEPFEKLIQTFTKIKITETLPTIKQMYKVYVQDTNDAHIIAGAQASKAKFLITYNTKHYNKEQIKRDFGILILTPAMFLQYLRSQGIV